MRYIVCSRGRAIGTTDLGFVRALAQVRSGWFDPNADGERVIASAENTRELTLHRDDGSLVRTIDIGFQDCEQLLRIAELDDARRESAGWDPEVDVLDAAIEAAAQHDLAIIDEIATEREAAEPPLPWHPDDEPVEFPRYQIHVVLEDESEIP